MRFSILNIMVELFFLKKFLIKNVFPYLVLMLSISYLLFEIFASKTMKTNFYLFLDKLYYIIVIRTYHKIKQMWSVFLVKLKVFVKSKIIKNREKKKVKEKKKIKKEQNKNEKSKIKLNKKINRLNNKVEKHNKKKNRKAKMKKIFVGIFLNKSKVKKIKK